MKNPLIRFLLIVGLSAMALATAGCASRNIESTSTRLKVVNPTGKDIDVTLPKNFDAEGFKIVINPKTGNYELSADKLRTDASGVIETATSKQAEALGKLAEAVIYLAPKKTAETEPAETD